MTTLAPAPSKWMDFMIKIYTNGQPPVLGSVSIKDIEEKAREVMKDHLRE